MCVFILAEELLGLVELLSCLNTLGLILDITKAVVCLIRAEVRDLITGKLGVRHRRHSWLQRWHSIRVESRLCVNLALSVVKLPFKCEQTTIVVVP